MSDGEDAMVSQQISTLFGIKTISLSFGFKYLGCFLRLGNYRILDSEWLVIKIQKTLSQWDHRWLTLGGRAIMIKSFL